MLRAKTAMGFKSVRRVEVKAETTTPGEVRTTTDANGMRVSTSRARRTLPKLEFVVEESGAILRGPQRGLYPYYASSQYYHHHSHHHHHHHHSHPPLPPSSSSSSHHFDHAATGVDAATSSATTREFAAHEDFVPASALEAMESLHRREVVAARGGDDSLSGAPPPTSPPLSTTAGPLPPMKDCVLNDSRATTLAIKFDPALGKFVCGSSIERFSGHTGVCRVLGSKKYPIIPHALQIGDLLRIGSVGLVVCELNRGVDESTEEALTEDEYRFIKENYLSVPLQQSFRPTDPRNHRFDDDDDEEDIEGRSGAGDDDDEDDDDDDDEDDEEQEEHAGIETRRHKLRSGETSDEGESEEDGHRNLSEDEDNQVPDAGDSTRGRRRRPGAKGALRGRMGAMGSREKRFCYICYDGDDEPESNPLVAPCNCKGDTKYVHLECLQRWNNNLDADGANPNHKLCAVTNTEGLDVCSICKATYLTSVKLEDGRLVSLMAKKLPPPYVTFAVVTQHETRSRSTALTNTRFQLSFANIPRGQQFLTIGRSTSNNMTLRYRTVSQLHAKVKFEDNQFYMYDAASSNGTMLFLSKPLELDWNKTMHVKIGRTILTLKSKKRWKWSGTGEYEDESSTTIASPQQSPVLVGDSSRQQSSMHRSSTGNQLDVDEINEQSSPARGFRQQLHRAGSSPAPYPSHQFNRTFLPASEFDPDLDNLRLSDIVDEGTILGLRASGSREYVDTPRLPSSGVVFADDTSPHLFATRRAHQSIRPSLEYVERLNSLTLESPRLIHRLSGAETMRDPSS